jgi:hypothetical protein
VTLRAMSRNLIGLGHGARGDDDIFTVGDDASGASTGAGAGRAHAHAHANAHDLGADQSSAGDASIFAGAAAYGGARLAGLRARVARDPAVTLRLAIKGALAVWALLVFALLCAAVSRAGSAPRPSAACADGNACTADLVVGGVGGGCAHAPLPDGTPCPGDAAAACYAPLVADAPRCRGGACVGATCRGVCAQAAECPPLAVRGAQAHGACYLGACVYVVSTRVALTAMQCDNDVFRDVCERIIDAAEPLRHCLRAASACTNSDLICSFSFACARPLGPQ